MTFVAKIVAGTLIVLVTLILLIVGCSALVTSGDDDAKPSAASSVPDEPDVETQIRTDTIRETVTVTTTVTVEKSPPSSGVRVNLGEWKGLFKIHGARVTSSFGTPRVIGQMEYLGGADCELGYIELDVTFFDSGGKIVGTGLWNTDDPHKGVRYPFETASLDEGAVARAELVMSDASCA